MKVLTKISQVKMIIFRCLIYIFEYYLNILKTEKIALIIKKDIIYMYMSVCAYMCVCLCVGEIGREREREINFI